MMTLIGNRYCPFSYRGSAEVLLVVTSTTMGLWMFTAVVLLVRLVKC